ncbi:MAG: hypothetical protein AAGD10_12680 [Myxococcota bacterium]
MIVVGPLFLVMVAQPVEPLQMDDMVRAAERIRPFVARVDVRLEVPQDQPLVPPEHWSFAVPWDETRLVALAPLVPDGAQIQVVGPSGRMEGVRLGADAENRVVLIQTPRPLRTLGLEAPTRGEAPAYLAHLFTVVGEGEGATVAAGQVLKPAPEFEPLVITDLKLSLGVPVFDEGLGLVGIGRTVAWDRFDNFVIPSSLLESSVDAILRGPAAPSPAPSPDEDSRPWWAKPIPKPSAKENEAEAHP